MGNITNWHFQGNKAKQYRNFSIPTIPYTEFMMKFDGVPYDTAYQKTYSPIYLDPKMLDYDYIMQQTVCKFDLS